MTRLSTIQGFDEVASVAINMPRGHNDKISIRWPRRGALAGEMLNDLLDDTKASGLICGFAEYPSRADEPLRDKGVKVTKAAPNHIDKRDKIGNAIGYLGEIRVKQGDYFTSLPYKDRTGRDMRLNIPVQLFKTKHRGELVVIQFHPPARVDAPDRIRMDLAEKALHVVKCCIAEDLSVLMPGDFNSTLNWFLRHNAELGHRADSQGVIGWNLNFRGKGGKLKTKGKIGDHSASPWAVAEVPYYGDKPDFKLPKFWN